MIDNYLSIHLSLGAILIKSAISYHADNLGQGLFLSLSHLFAFSRRHWRNVCVQLERFSIYSILHLYLSLPGT